LASDEMEGRAPGGKGEELATADIADFFKSIGLKTQFQAVPMVGIKSAVFSFKVSGKRGSPNLKIGEEINGWAKETKGLVSGFGRSRLLRLRRGGSRVPVE